jgi:hypothetical protein
MRPVVVGTLAAAAIVGCGGGTEPQERAVRGPVTPVQDCRHRVEGAGARPSPRRLRKARAEAVVLRGITFAGLRLAEDAPIRRDPYWKSGVAVRYGPPLTVEVSPPATLAYSDEVDGPGEGSRAVRFEPCPPNTPSFSRDGSVGDETFFAGGFLVTRPACVMLTVRRAGQPTQRVPVGFGRRCR